MTAAAQAGHADAAITVRGVGKRFRRRHEDRPRTLHEAILRGGWRRLWSEPTPFWAVRDVTFCVPRGSMVGVVGANGAGKTTLLRLVGGVLPADEGAVTVRGRVGALEVGAAFHPELTGRECVLAGGVIAGLTRRAVLARFDRVVEFAGLSDRIDDPLRTYSTGMRMRLAFAVAAHTDPEVLLVDEVLAVGDAGFQQKCLGRIAELRADGCALLLVSHDTALVAQLCDRALLMERGRLAAEGPAAEVVARYHAGGAASAGARLQHGQNRFGTGAVEITGVEVLGAPGPPAGHVTSGGPAVVQLRYRAEAGVRAVFNVLLTRADGAHCCDLSAAPVSPAAEGVVTLHVERLDLAPGQYFADVGAYEAGGDVTFDYHWNVHPFVVAAPAEAGECGAGAGKGMLLPPHRWSLTP